MVSRWGSTIRAHSPWRRGEERGERLGELRGEERGEPAGEPLGESCSLRFFSSM
jgi:hypothetical protein